MVLNESEDKEYEERNKEDGKCGDEGELGGVHGGRGWNHLFFKMDGFSFCDGLIGLVIGLISLVRSCVLEG